MITRVDAHNESLREPVPEMAGRLQEALGQRLVAYVVGVRSPKLVGRWATGATEPREQTETRLRDLWEIVRILEHEGPEVTRAWLLGANPQLDDQAPAALLRDGRSAEVGRAAEAFAEH